MTDECQCGRCQTPGLLTGIEKAALQPLKDVWIGPDQERPTKAADELDRIIVKWLRGEVDAS